MAAGEITRHERHLHGHRVSYLTAGEGPLVVLLHGITQSAACWSRVIPRLAERYQVLAPDLCGHGESAKPIGDYSMGAYASAVRDLMGALGHRRATVVGHSLGGGIAMQFSYQFPERTERLVLVSSGGLGRDVHGAMRAATLPGSELVLPLLALAPLRDAVETVGRAFGRIGFRAAPDLAESWKGFASLGDDDARRAFIATLRASVDPGGQRVLATDRLYLAGHLPTLLVWGARDRIIPAAHGIEAAEHIPGARLELFPDAGHFPHISRPGRFAAAVVDFLEDTEAAEIGEDHWREVLAAEAAGV